MLRRLAIRHFEFYRPLAAVRKIPSDVRNFPVFVHSSATSVNRILSRIRDMMSELQRMPSPVPPSPAALPFRKTPPASRTPPPRPPKTKPPSSPATATCSTCSPRGMEPKPKKSPAPRQPHKWNPKNFFPLFPSCASARTNLKHCPPRIHPDHDPHPHRWLPKIPNASAMPVILDWFMLSRLTLTPFNGVTGNIRMLSRLRYEVAKLWRRWLQRRNRSSSPNWERFQGMLSVFPLFPARIVHSNMQ